MTEVKSWTSICQDAGDGSGDLIVELPPDLITRLGLKAGDVFTMEVIHGAIVFNPKEEGFRSRLKQSCTVELTTGWSSRTEACTNVTGWTRDRI